MYNKNMRKRAKNDNAQYLKAINKTAVGFTIIETMLFLAIAGLIFVGIIVGTNGTIRQQRYKDAVQGFVDDLRDLYSLAENTQVLDYGNQSAECVGIPTGSGGRGRSNCSVYGIYAIISPTHAGRENVEAFWVTGTDQASLVEATNDRDYLGEEWGVGVNKGANVSIVTFVEHERVVLTAKSHSLLWGADIEIPCATNKDANGCGDLEIGRSNDKNQVALFIYRSPVTGSINTMTQVWNDGNKESILQQEEAYKAGENLGQNLTEGNFSHQDVSFCISGAAGLGYSGGMRMVTIDGNGSNSSAVRLIEGDSEDNKCND